MKGFLIVLFGLLAVSANAQEQDNKATPEFNEDKLWENAKFQVKRHELHAYTTDLEIFNTAVSAETLLEIKRKIYTKEGIFKVERLKGGKILRIYHLSYIEIETIKSFILPYVPEFHPNERVLFYMN